MKDFVKIFLLLFVLSVAKANPLLSGEETGNDEGEWDETIMNEEELLDKQGAEETENDEEEWDEAELDEGHDMTMEEAGKWLEKQKQQGSNDDDDGTRLRRGKNNSIR